MLARAVREVETAVQRGAVRRSVRTKFQVVALLVREERARVKADTTVTEAQRAEQLKRLDGVATILAKTAARDTSLLQLLAEDAVVSDAGRGPQARDARGRRRRAAARGARAGRARRPRPPRTSAGSCPQSVVSRQLANPFLAPDFSAAEQRQRRARAGWPRWELLGPLFRSFEYAAAARRLHGRCPSPRSLRRRPASS